MLELSCAGVESHVGALLERDQANPVQLALERPVGAGESLLGERGRHGLDPLGKLGAPGGGGVYIVRLRHASWTRGRSMGPARAAHEGVAWQAELPGLRLMN